MSERITVSAPNGTREELLGLARKEGMNLSRYMTDPAAQMTYICEHRTGKLKVGVSNNPKTRATKFGRIVCIIFDSAAEQLILKNFQRVSPPDGIKEGVTEWIEEDLVDVENFAKEQGFDVLTIVGGYENKGNGRPPKPACEARTVVVHTNLTVAEKRAVSLAAEAAGISVSDYLRSKII